MVQPPDGRVDFLYPLKISLNDLPIIWIKYRSPSKLVNFINCILISLCFHDIHSTKILVHGMAIVKSLLFLVWKPLHAAPWTQADTPSAVARGNLPWAPRLPTSSCGMTLFRWPGGREVHREKLMQRWSFNPYMFGMLCFTKQKHILTKWTWGLRHI